MTGASTVQDQSVPDGFLVANHLFGPLLSRQSHLLDVKPMHRILFVSTQRVRVRVRSSAANTLRCATTGYGARAGSPQRPSSLPTPYE